YFLIILGISTKDDPEVLPMFSSFVVSSLSCQKRDGTTRARDLAMVRVLAFAKLGTLGYCSILLSDVHQGDTPRLLFIYQRWINSMYL
ncbi:hypothetical protein ACJX0J_009498, partial [Zea mays]